MFGPFNTVRAVLVGGAAVAAIVSAALGWVGATIVLVVAILAHGVLWLWMWQRAQVEGPPEEGHPNVRGGTAEV